MLDRFAEEANYWLTTVHPAKSQAEVFEMLEDFDVVNRMMTQGQAQGRHAWLVRFEWREATYRFVFRPLTCKYPDKESSFGGKRRRHEDQARYQMGRIAAHFIKALLTAAEAQPAALFGFLELPGATRSASGLPATAAEVDVSVLTERLQTGLLLPSGVDDVSMNDTP